MKQKPSGIGLMMNEEGNCGKRVRRQGDCEYGFVISELETFNNEVILTSNATDI